MIDLLETYDAWLAEGVEVGRAVVIRTFGSAPRTEGAILLVAADGRMVGSVSGGCVEAAAAAEVLRARETGHSRVIRYGITDEQAWDVGLACGGTIDVLVEPMVPDAVVQAARDARAPVASEGAAIILRLPADLPPPRLEPFEPGDGGPPQPAERIFGAEAFGEPVGSTSIDRDPRLIDAVRSALEVGRSRIVEHLGRADFVEVVLPRPRLVVVGATEVTRRLVALAREVGYATIVVDARSAFATSERFPDVDALIGAWPDQAFESIGLGPLDAVAVLSHDPKLDEPAILEAFRRGACYVGAVGSRATQAGRRERLVAAGLSRDDLERLRGPIGLDLGGREPAETALAIIAEVVAARRGGTGLPLRERAAVARTGPRGLASAARPAG